jgi:hypothetical protein
MGIIEVKSDHPGEGAIMKEIIGVNFMVYNMPNEAHLEFKEYCRLNKCNFEQAIRALMQNAKVLNLVSNLAGELTDLKQRVELIENADTPKVKKSLGERHLEKIEDGKTE